MALYPIRGIVRDTIGRVVQNATVVIREHGSVTVATVYSTESGGVAVTSLSTDSLGQFLGWVSDADYPLMQLLDVTVTKDATSVEYPAFSFTSFSGPMLASEVMDMDHGTAPPATGTYAKGFIRWNSDPDAGEEGGWICVAGGTPGTWKAFALISG